MKQLRVLFSVIASASILLAWSCSDPVEIPEVSGTTEGDNPAEVVTPSLGGSVSFFGTIDEQQGPFSKWSEGASILFSDGKQSSTLPGSLSEGGSGASFQGNVPSGDNSFVAVFPAEGSSISGTLISAVLPSRQGAVEGDFDPVLALKVAKGSTSTLFFRNLVSAVKFTLDIDGVQKVTLTAGDKIAGDITVDYSSEEPVAVATSNTVELSGEFSKGAEYWIVTLPGNLEGGTIVVSTAEGDMAHVTLPALGLGAGEVFDAGVISQDLEIYTITHLWLWGGTGPEYDCTKVYDLFDKAEYFLSEGGLGVEAERDNYLEFHPDGTFINWAGEDGHNWCTVYAGEKNPDSGKTINLSQFYRMIPFGTASYTVDGSTVTFKHADGHETVGEMLPAGLYQAPNTPPIDINIEGVALKFVLSGGADNWSHAWDEYGVIACHPRVLFVELDKKSAGFKTPEASKTVDEVYEYVEPKDPEPPADLGSLAGSYKVHSLQVLGGTGDDPAFVNPVDKSWCWDDSIWWESDNRLEISFTSVTETSASGSANYWSGDDEKFWNYSYANVPSGVEGPIDLSGYYGKLPHGESPFSVDLSTNEITFELSGEKATILLPGEHLFSAGNKTLAIPAGCIGLDFKLLDEQPASSYRWQDYDRFVLGPRTYVMIFEKL